MLLDCTIDSDKRACPTAAAAVLLNLNPGFWDTSMTILLKNVLEPPSHHWNRIRFRQKPQWRERGENYK
ncbi:hypothetical protein MTP99_004459 [Tenebrio molitor]|jgi:hypothetical protein|nr:hypothetical protein MTP99_004459 [Tenebrio molitor]